jgi:dihydroorotase
MTTLFIKNGRVIDPASGKDGKLGVLVRDGKVADVTSGSEVPDDARVIDAKGMIVAPGFIDMHVHLRDPGYEYKEDIASGTAAAVAGGVTSVLSMPNTDPVNDCASVTEYILEQASKVGSANVYPAGSITRGLKGETLADIGDMARAGVKAVTDDGRPVVDSGVMRRAMEYAMAFDLLIISHSEDLALAASGVMNEGAVSVELGLRGIPAAAEEAMVARDIMIAELAGARLHLAHVSTAGSVKLVREAKGRGAKVTAEVTPHHLTFTEDAVSDYDPNTKVNPPLRTELDRRAVIKALADGTIDAIATDHAPHNIIDKEAGFEEAAFGLIGLETMLPLALALVHDKKITMKRMIEALTEAPARILGLAGKGTLAAGSDADITIFDPDETWTVQSSKFKSKSRNTPFEGLRVRGRVRYTIVGGEVVHSAQKL